GVAEPVVEPIRAALPEFDASRGQQVSAPKGRSGDFLAGIFRFHFPPSLFESGPVRDRFALLGGPGCYAAPARSASEISVRFCRRQLRDRSGNADVAFLIR